MIIKAIKIKTKCINSDKTYLMAMNMRKNYEFNKEILCPHHQIFEANQQERKRYRQKCTNSRRFLSQSLLKIFELQGAVSESQIYDKANKQLNYLLGT